MITATSMKTPTPVSSKVENAIARYTCFLPRPFTTACEIDDAAPVLMSTPESTPAARIRKIAGVISLTPESI